MSLDWYRGQTALVTGASGGIGAEMARQLGAAGARVVLVARSEDALAARAAEIRQAGGAATVLPADLGTPDAAESLAARLADAGETVDVLVNNAGFGVQGRFLEHSADASEGMVLLNVLALTSLTRRLLPDMVRRGRGGVLNVASTAAFFPAPYFAVYAATKAYVQSFSEALWGEMRGTSVHVSCLSPGPVDTGFGDRAGMSGTFFAAGEPVEKVARMGLEGLAADDRRVVPGAQQKVSIAASRFIPSGALLRVAGALMKGASQT